MTRLSPLFFVAGGGAESRAIEYRHARRANAVVKLSKAGRGKTMRFGKFAAEFRGITDDRRLAPRSPGSDGAFLMESRDAACFVMLAGLLCSCSR